MEKQIPIYFDSIITDAPLQEIDSKTFRLRVGAFYKYKNRNYSYITDEYAELLIKSATRGNVPVIGFFDPQSEDWSSHTGPTLASAYGYVEAFLGWEPLKDSDGVEREYAIFSVILFTDYFEEAQKIKGQNQSMELNPATITGEWADLDDGSYYVYKTGDMLGFCVIGSHEPCFSASSFFSKNDANYESQYEKFSLLLSDLKARVEQGGEHPMDENQEIVEEIQSEEEQVQEQEPESEQVQEQEPEQKTVVVNEFETLYNELQAEFTTLQENYNAAQERIAQLEQYQAQNEELRSQIETLQASISTYEAQIQETENNRKNELIETYALRIEDNDALNIIKESSANFSFDELESKLAILFSKEQFAKEETPEVKVPLIEQPEESEFARLMKNYKIHN